MKLGTGESADPGNFRKQAVKVGNLIPPPAPEIPELMAALERFIHTDESLPVLIKAGLAHVQFETIHPFLDGNGRIGRLLIVLMLIENKIVSSPILYPSYYFKKYHLEYYQKLDRVRTHGDFEGWLQFYLTAIIRSCQDAYKRAKEIEALSAKLIDALKKEKLPAQQEELRLRALSIIFGSPVISVQELARQLDVAYNTARKIIAEFSQLTILHAQEKQKRGKLFEFKRYLEVLEKEF